MRVSHIAHSVSFEHSGGIGASIINMIEALSLTPIDNSILTYAHLPRSLVHPYLSHLIHTIPSFLHFHGLWRPHCRLAIPTQPYVVSVHGMLMPRSLCHSLPKKLISLGLYERHLLANARHIIVQNKEESQMASLLFPSSSIINLPNSAHIPNADLPPPALPWFHTVKANHRRILLFFGRFHPIKGIDPLLAAWRLFNDNVPHDFHLAFVGSGHAYIQRMFKKYRLLSPTSNCSFHDPVYDCQKSQLLSNVDAFILPSFSEGSSVSALEAMSFGLPCILSTSAASPLFTDIIHQPLDAPFLTREAIITKPSPPSISASLFTLLRLDSRRLRDLGNSGREYVRINSNSTNYANQLSSLYATL